MSVATTPNLVGGEWLAGGETIDVVNPADVREVVGAVPSMSAEEVAAVYEAAAAGAATWGATSKVERGRILFETARLLRERQADLAALITAEMGKTIGEATVEVQKSADFFEYFGGLGRAGRGEVLAHERSDVLAYTLHEPLGVVLAITPWNDPLLTPARKLAPALIAGNAVVLKPATVTPLIGLALARCIADAGAPAGVVNTITGSGGKLGDSLIASPHLRGVSFTGSNEVGEALRRSLAGTRVGLLAELGGKNAAVVLADADLDRAADTVVAAGYAQAGQRCTATSRLIVERAVAGELVERLSRRVEGLVVGPGAEAATQVSPLVSRDQQESVAGFVERAASGASLVIGGAIPDAEPLRNGCYVEPTLLSGVDPGSEIWTDEVFGPVVAIVEVDSEAEALEVLNGSRYGLAAALYSGSAAAAQRFVAAADAGQIAINLPTSGWDVHMPFGGFKASGSGHKEQGVEGLHFYQRTKTVAAAG
jgi:acyl-CoA reductase-like NAD-dependent aldehyde dehydrogenase